MKKRIVVPKFAKVFLCLASLFLVIALTLDLLGKNNIYLYIHDLEFNISNIYPILYVIVSVLFAIGMILMIMKTSKNKILRSVTVILLAVIAPYISLLQLFGYNNETYHEFVSPDNEHVIFIYETGVFQSGVIKFYEKTSPFIIKKIAVCNTDDCYSPIENNTYEIKWNDNGFEFHYDFTGSGREYKIEKIEYVK